MDAPHIGLSKGRFLAATGKMKCVCWELFAGTVSSIKMAYGWARKERIVDVWGNRAVTGKFAQAHPNTSHNQFLFSIKFSSKLPWKEKSKHYIKLVLSLSCIATTKCDWITQHTNSACSICQHYRVWGNRGCHCAAALNVMNGLELMQSSIPYESYVTFRASCAYVVC